VIAPSGGGTAVKLKEMKFQGRSWMKMLPARKQREVSHGNLTGFLLLQYHDVILLFPQKLQWLQSLKAAL